MGPGLHGGVRMRLSFAKRCLTTVVAMLTIGAPAGYANATVIGFESATTRSCQATAGGSVGGFSLTPDSGGFNSAPRCTSLFAMTANSGLKYMTSFYKGFGEFTKDDGTFTLESLYVHADTRKGRSQVRFQGLDGIGGTVLYTMDEWIKAQWQQIVFPGWTNVKTLTWDSITPDVSNISIDDFEFTAAGARPAARSFAAVPTPATLALFGTGLAILGVGRRRRNPAG